MSDYAENAPVSKLKKAGIYCAITAAAIAGLVLFAWALDIEVIKRIMPDLNAMNPATAVCILFSAASFFLIKHPETNSSKRKAGLGLAVLILLLSIIKLFGIICEKEVYFDTNFIKRLDIKEQMALSSAISFVLLSLSLLFIDAGKKRNRLPSQYISALILFISILSILGYLYRISFFYHFRSHIPMAIHAAFAFMLMALAVLFSNVEKGFMRELIRTKSGAAVAGILIPSAILIPSVLGYFRLFSEWNGYFESGLGTSLLIISIIIFLLIVIWFAIKNLNQRETLRIHAEKRLSAANSELSSFTYTVSHDLRAPLRALNGYAQILIRDHNTQLDDEAKQYLESIRLNALRMGNLVDDLLRFAHLGKKDLEYDEVDMHALTLQTIKQIHSNLQNKAKIILEPLHPIKGDGALLQQAMYNLISNAVKYTSKKEDPEIRIFSEAKEHSIIYTIKDNGAGFDMRFYDKLFGVFNRLHNRDEFEGTGVGLAIVDRIITKHNGRVWAHSVPNEGATFSFELPKRG